MKSLLSAFIASYLFIFLAGNAFGQQKLVTQNQQIKLENFSNQLKQAYQANKQKAIAVAASSNWVIRKETPGGSTITLQGINPLGFPIYFRTDNTEAAAATRTNVVQPGGELALNLSGSSTVLNNKLAIWDEGTVYASHREFSGKTITIPTGQAGAQDHATHVAGTMIAQGIAASVKGMAFNMSTLKSYDYDNDVSKISNNASGLLLSNHSYGDIAGWDGDTWYGLPGDSVDFLFGFYDNRAQAFDKIAHEAPYYLIVESAGNSHAYTGPPVGSSYMGYKSRTDSTIVDKGPRPPSISSNDGYDVISTTGNAKNILTVGSVGQLPNGPRTREDVRISSYSSWGPTDDGRIKPDIVGMGESVISTSVSGGYNVKSGTSMSSPNVTGSLLLLQEYYAQMHHDSVMLAATLKGLACHTAFDAGNVGPDYKYGWGLLDMRKAAQTITNNGINSYIKEDNLQQGQTVVYEVAATGNEPLSATIAWTDPEGTPPTYGTINDRTPRLVNDLDISITGNGVVFDPWILDPERPEAPATTGNNIRDNIEQVFVSASTAGTNGTITVSHKGVLRGGSQNYSLIVTGGIINRVSTVNTNKELSAFPVPANDKITVLFNVNQAGTLKLQLFNLVGTNVYTSTHQVTAGNFSSEIGVANLANGVYVLKLVTDGQVYTRKVLVIK